MTHALKRLTAVQNTYTSALVPWKVTVSGAAVGAGVIDFLFVNF